MLLAAAVPALLPLPQTGLFFPFEAVFGVLILALVVHGVRTRASWLTESHPVELALTALFAASIGLVQNDIKKVLAYSTVSQLGYMVMACGLGAYAAGILCKTVTPDPLTGLAVAISVAASMGLLTSLLVLRGTDLTRLMVTLGVSLVLHELANSLTKYTGGADGLQGRQGLMQEHRGRDDADHALMPALVP